MKRVFGSLQAVVSGGICNVFKKDLNYTNKQLHFITGRGKYVRFAVPSSSKTPYPKALFSAFGRLFSLYLNSSIFLSCNRFGSQCWHHWHSSIGVDSIILSGSPLKIININLWTDKQKWHKTQTGSPTSTNFCLRGRLADRICISFKWINE